MSEPERKVRKTKRSDTVSKPEVTVQIAEPVTDIKKEQEEERTRNRSRQLNVEAVPFEFLPSQQKEEILFNEHLEEMKRLEEAEREAKNSKKAKALLGVFIGAGLGMWLAYLVKDKLFSPAVEAAVEAASVIVEDQK